MWRRKPPLSLDICSKTRKCSECSIYSTLYINGAHAHGPMSVELLPPVHSRASRACAQLPTKMEYPQEQG